MRLSVPALALSFCAALVAASPVPEPTNDIDWSKVFIEDTTYSGSGCPPKSVEVIKNSDWTIVTLAFSEYVASIGPDSKFKDKYKNCNINVKLHYPSGWQYTLYQTDYTGFADLEKGVKATQRSEYWFAGFPKKAVLKSEFEGPMSKPYSFTDILVNEACVWSPCGKSTTLNIDTSLHLDNKKHPKNSGLITTNVIDHSVRTLHYLRWQRC